MDWRRLDYLWITVMFFLSAVLTLVLMAPIHYIGEQLSNATFLQICFDKETN